MELFMGDNARVTVTAVVMFLIGLISEQITYLKFERTITTREAERYDS
jgi:hypothetical protein